MPLTRVDRLARKSKDLQPTAAHEMRVRNRPTTAKEIDYSEELPDPGQGPTANCVPAQLLLHCVLEAPGNVTSIILYLLGARQKLWCRGGGDPFAQ